MIQKFNQPHNTAAFLLIIIAFWYLTFPVMYQSTAPSKGMQTTYGTKNQAKRKTRHTSLDVAPYVLFSGRGYHYLTGQLQRKRLAGPRDLQIYWHFRRQVSLLNRDLELSDLNRR